MRDEWLQNETEIESMDTGAWGSASLEMPDTWQYEGAGVGTFFLGVNWNYFDEVCTINKFM